MEKKEDISLKEDNTKEQEQKNQEKDEGKMKIDVTAFLNKKKERTDEDEGKMTETNKKPIAVEDIKKITSTEEKKTTNDTIFTPNAPILFTKNDNGNENKPLFGQPANNSNSLFPGLSNATFGSGLSSTPLFGSFTTQAQNVTNTKSIFSNNTTVENKKEEKPQPIFAANPPLFEKKEDIKPLFSKPDDNKPYISIFAKSGDKPIFAAPQPKDESKPTISIPQNEPKKEEEKPSNPPQATPPEEPKQKITLPPKKSPTPPKQDTKDIRSKSKSPAQIATPPSSQQKPLIGTNAPIGLGNQPITLPELPAQPTKKVISFLEAKKEIEDFTAQLSKMEEDLSKKYSITFPDMSYEDALPDDIKIKIVEDFFDSQEIKDLLTKIK